MNTQENGHKWLNVLCVFQQIPVLGTCFLGRQYREVRVDLQEVGLTGRLSGHERQKTLLREGSYEMSPDPSGLLMV